LGLKELFGAKLVLMKRYAEKGFLNQILKTTHLKELFGAKVVLTKLYVEQGFLKKLTATLESYFLYSTISILLPTSVALGSCLAWTSGNA